MSKVVGMVADALTECAENIDFDAPDPNITAEKEAIKQSIKKEESRIEKLLDAYFADAITVDELKERRAASEENIEKLKAQSEELRKRQTPKKYKTNLKKAIRLLKDENIPAQLKNDALKTIIERIEYSNEPVEGNKPFIRLNIQFRVPNDDSTNTQVNQS